MKLADADINYLCNLVAEHSGNVITPRQSYLIEQRLTPLAESLGLADLPSLVSKLRHSPNQLLTASVAEAVTVNETSFYRDAHPFEILQQKILPELLREKGPTQPIRIWCAASSSGQEPYSIAMLIRERFPEARNVRIVATDICEKMLNKMRSGEYSRLEVNRGLPTRRLLNFFDRDGAIWRAKPDLRSMIECRRLNLTHPWPNLGQFDIVFIRNVLIYFSQTTKADILRRASHLLTPQGYLFVGSSEMIVGLDVPLRREEIDATVCYRPITG
ncbi:MAG: chemotaxis protein methyltransferase CheR [Pirellulaceae bacterium]|jgi:chemotaxis protein methyltransferase CheR